jgi:hypothetical protein
VQFKLYRTLKPAIPRQDEAGCKHKQFLQRILACKRYFELYGLRAHGESFQASDCGMELAFFFEVIVGR